MEKRLINIDYSIERGEDLEVPDVRSTGRAHSG
jgi:hypothetical protein